MEYSKYQARYSNVMPPAEGTALPPGRPTFLHMRSLHFYITKSLTVHWSVGQEYSIFHLSIVVQQMPGP